MRLIYTLTIILSFFVFSAEAKTVINGRINKSNIEISLSIAQEPISGFKYYQKSITNDKGEFKFEFFIDDAKPFYIRYSDTTDKNNSTKMHKIWVEPNTTMHLEINNKLSIKGANKKENMILREFGFALNTNSIYYDTTSFNFDLVAGIADSIYNIKINNFYKNISSSNFSDVFKNFLYTEIKTENQRDKLRYIIEYSYIKKLPVSNLHHSASFQKFIKSVNFLNDSSILSLGYRNFLHEYFDYLSYEYLMPGENYTMRYFRLLDANLKHHKLTKAFLKVKIFNMSIGSVNNIDTITYLYSDILKENVDTLITRKIEKKYSYVINKLVNDFKLPDVYVLDTNGNKVLLNSYLGKLTYIDFWGTWCKPCMEAMPFQKYLEEKYRNENVTFIYLNNNDPHELWISSINKINLSGYHFKLDKEAAKLLSEYFIFTTYPYYAILDENNIPIKKFGDIRPKVNAERIIDEILGIK